MNEQIGWMPVFSSVLINSKWNIVCADGHTQTSTKSLFALLVQLSVGVCVEMIVI